MKLLSQIPPLILFIMPYLAHASNYGTASVFYSGEMVPKSQASIEFRFPHCPLSSRLLDVQSRESFAKLKSQDTGKDVDVRYVYLIGKLDGAYRKCPTKPVQISLNYQIPADQNKMTHFFVSVESPAKIVSVKSAEQ